MYFMYCLLCVILLLTRLPSGRVCYFCSSALSKVVILLADEQKMHVFKSVLRFVEAAHVKAKCESKW